MAIMDADKEGFLRTETSLIQTIGRVARNVDSKVLMYCDRGKQSYGKLQLRKPGEGAVSSRNITMPTGLHRPVSERQFAT